MSGFTNCIQPRGYCWMEVLNIVWECEMFIQMDAKILIFRNWGKGGVADLNIDSWFKKVMGVLTFMGEWHLFTFLGIDCYVIVATPVCKISSSKIHGMFCNCYIRCINVENRSVSVESYINVFDIVGYVLNIKDE